jgi:hypothetical protein
MKSVHLLLQNTKKINSLSWFLNIQVIQWFATVELFSTFIEPHFYELENRSNLLENSRCILFL